MTIKELEGKKLPDLRELAKNAGITNVESLKKNELVQLIFETTASASNETPTETTVSDAGEKKKRTRIIKEPVYVVKDKNEPVAESLPEPVVENLTQPTIAPEESIAQPDLFTTNDAPAEIEATTDAPKKPAKTAKKGLKPTVKAESDTAISPVEVTSEETPSFIFSEKTEGDENLEPKVAPERKKSNQELFRELARKKRRV